MNTILRAEFQLISFNRFIVCQISEESERGVNENRKTRKKKGWPQKQNGIISSRKLITLKKKRNKNYLQYIKFNKKERKNVKLENLKWGLEQCIKHDTRMS